MTDIFDLSSLADLPPDLRNDLKISKRGQFEQRLIDLFEMAGRELTLDEVIVGYFRVYGEELDRNKVNIKLYNMSRAIYPAVKSVEGKKGVYVLKTEATHVNSENENVNEEEAE